MSTGKKLTIFLCMTGMLAMLCTGCGKKEEAGQQPDTNKVAVEESTEVQEPAIEETTAVVEESTEEVVEEIVEESTTEKPKVEMVDFDTWAKQEGNDEVCLVVWNEELGIQEVITSLSQSDEVYKIHEGDRFAIPYRKNIDTVIINEETGKFQNDEYLEIELAKETDTVVYIIYKDEKGTEVSLPYGFTHAFE